MNIVPIDQNHRIVLDAKTGADFQILKMRPRHWQSNLTASLSAQEMNRLCTAWNTIREEELYKATME